MINSFINSCSSLENHTRCQTKMGKVYRGGSRIFFRRGCTRLLLYFNTINHIVFFLAEYQVYQKTAGHLRGGVRNPCTLPLDPPLVYTCFQTRTAQKTLPLGAVHTYAAHTSESPFWTNIRHTLIVKRKSKRKGPYQCDRDVQHYVWMWSTLINMCTLKFHSIRYVEFSEFQSPVLSLPC